MYVFITIYLHSIEADYICIERTVLFALLLMCSRMVGGREAMGQGGGQGGEQRGMEWERNGMGMANCRAR